MFRQDIDEIKDFSLVEGSETWGESACALSCVFDLVEQLKCKYYTPRKAKLIAYDLYHIYAIDQNFTVLWVETLAYFGIDAEVTFTSADYICKPGEYEILKLVKPGYAHFVRGDGKGNYTWDSLGIRDAQKDYIVGEKRIIRIKGIL